MTPPKHLEGIRWVYSMPRYAHSRLEIKCLCHAYRYISSSPADRSNRQERSSTWPERIYHVPHALCHRGIDRQNNFTIRRFLAVSRKDSPIGDEQPKLHRMSMGVKSICRLEYRYLYDTSTRHDTTPRSRTPQKADSVLFVVPRIGFW